MIMGTDENEIRTWDEPDPDGNTQEGCTKLRNRRKRQNNSQSMIYMGCSDQILPEISHTIDPAEMWDILHDRFDDMLSKLGQTQILRKVHARHPAKE